MRNERIVVSYNSLRVYIGWMALLMPCLLLIWTLPHQNCNGVLSSISIYYHSMAGHIFTTVSVLIAVVFFMYDGYDKDYIIMNIAAMLILGVGLIPNEQTAAIADCVLSDCKVQSIGRPGCFIRQNSSKILANLHLACAVGFFGLLSYISLCLFTKTDKSVLDMGAAKRNRNRVFKFCGIGILVIMALLGVFFWGRKDWAAGLEQYNPIFWGEWAMIALFGICWLTKGQALLKD